MNSGILMEYSLVHAALRYTALGLSVAPLLPRSKFFDYEALGQVGSLDFRGRPSWRTFSRRLPTPAEIESWFSSGERNLAILTGFRGLLVLDFDAPSSYDRWSAAFGHVAARTSVQQTSRGFHVFFRWPGVWITRWRTGIAFRLLGDAVDRAGQMKGPATYVAAWPSIHPSGWRYSWLPGQAPWEAGIADIHSLREIGIEPDKKIPDAYWAFALKTIKDPGLGLRFLWRWLVHRVRTARGRPARY